MLDLRCYFVTGTNMTPEIAAAAVRGGAGVVQVRSKPISARTLYDLGARVAEAVHEVNPRAHVLIDDRVDVALALRCAGAPVHGVHIGQDDLCPRAARELLGPDAIIGLTTGTLELIRDANQYADVLDYVGCGPFRATPTKDSGRTPLGLEGYPEIVAASQLPVVAIGDVTADDAAELAATGVDGLAVVRGIMNAPDPAAYCERLLSEFEKGRA